MSFALPTLAALLPDATMVRHRAVDLLPAGFPGKLNKANARAEAIGCLCRATLEIAGRHLAEQIELSMLNAASMHEMLEGERVDADNAAAWDATLYLALQTDVQGAIDAVGAHVAQGCMAPDMRLDQADTLGQAAAALAAAVMDRKSPPVADRGKFLSAIGIVAADIDDLASGELTSAEHEVLGPLIGSPAAGEAVPEAAAPVAAPAAAEKAQRAPMHTEIIKAWKQWDLAVDMSPKNMAKALDISIGTLDNWRKGKTKAALEAPGLDVMLQDVDARMAALAYAKGIFSRLRAAVVG